MRRSRRLPGYGKPDSAGAVRRRDAGTGERREGVGVYVEGRTGNRITGATMKSTLDLHFFEEILFEYGAEPTKGM